VRDEASYFTSVPLSLFTLSAGGMPGVVRGCLCQRKTYELLAEYAVLFYVFRET